MDAAEDDSVRIRDINRGLNPRKRCPSDNPEAQRIRNQRRKLNNSKPRGKLEYLYDTEQDKLSLLNKLDTVKMILGKGKVSGTSTFTVLTHILDYFLEKHTGQGNPPNPIDDETHQSPIYQYVTKEEALQDDIFLCTRLAIDNLISRLGEHSATCASGNYKINKHNKFHHVLSASVKCAGGHNIDWVSSPHIEGGKFLANVKMAHGTFISGILPNQYVRLCDAAGIGTMSATYRDSLQNGYSTDVEEEAKQSQLESLNQEIALSFASGQENGINILTDARHCWRRNARFTDVVCLGDSSHKVLHVDTVSKADDPCSQRHELIGVKRLYDYLEEQQCPVIHHGHDNNASVTKFVYENTESTNCLDTWHMAKGLARDTKKITCGSKKMNGIVWHEQLSDKAASIKTHVYWCMKHAQGDATKLRNSIDNIIPHYKNIHTNCHPTSRCKTDPLYEPTKFCLSDSNAENILRQHLHRLPVYKKAEMYSFCKDTHYVESFNNAVLQTIMTRE